MPSDAMAGFTRFFPLSQTVERQQTSFRIQASWRFRALTPRSHFLRLITLDEHVLSRGVPFVVSIVLSVLLYSFFYL
jgi:hypothetical protein